jgi:hypothetical protein
MTACRTQSFVGAGGDGCRGAPLRPTAAGPLSTGWVARLSVQSTSGATHPRRRLSSSTPCANTTRWAIACLDTAVRLLKRLRTCDARHSPSSTSRRGSLNNAHTAGWAGVPASLGAPLLRDRGRVAEIVTYRGCQRTMGEDGTEGTDAVACRGADGMDQETEVVTVT